MSIDSTHNAIDLAEFAPIWRRPNPSLASRRLSARSRGSARGFVIDPVAHRQINIESGLEWHVAIALLARRDIVELREQPEGIFYFDPDGKRRFHVFDFLATKATGARVAIAVKPESKSRRLRRDLPYMAAQLPRSFANEVVLITDLHIDPITIHNAKLIHEMRKRANPASDRKIQALISLLLGATSIGSLVEECGMGSDGFASVVRHISVGNLTVRRHERLQFETVVVSSLQLNEKA